MSKNIKFDEVKRQTMEEYESYNKDKTYFEITEMKFDQISRTRARNTENNGIEYYPEDETRKGIVYIDANSVYKASDYGFDVFSDFIVNVFAKPYITGKDEEGNDWKVEFDDNGNVDMTAIPAKIAVLSEPNNIAHEGTAIDYTGVRVQLRKSDDSVFTNEKYPTGEVPFDELQFPVTIAVMNHEDYNPSTNSERQKVLVMWREPNTGEILQANFTITIMGGAEL